MAVITLASEFKTDSQKVAAGVAETLGIQYIGDRLVVDIAKSLRISEHEAGLFRQASQSSILRFLDRYTCSVIQRVVDREHGCLDDDAYYRKTREVVENIYEKENAVILGWGASCILQSKPETFHVLLRKDDEKKIREIMKTRRLGQKAAEHMVKTEENDRKAYIRKYFNMDWMDPALYDLIIDMGTHTVEEAIAFITKNARRQLKTL